MCIHVWLFMCDYLRVSYQPFVLREDAAHWPVVPPLQILWVWLLWWLHLAGSSAGCLGWLPFSIHSSGERGSLPIWLLGQSPKDTPGLLGTPLHPDRVFSAGQSKSCSWLRWRRRASLHFGNKQHGKYVLGRKLYCWRPSLEISISPI